MRQIKFLSWEGYSENINKDLRRKVFGYMKIDRFLGCLSVVCTLFSTTGFTLMIYYWEPETTDATIILTFATLFFSRVGDLPCFFQNFYIWWFSYKRLNKYLAKSNKFRIINFFIKLKDGEDGEYGEDGEDGNKGNKGNKKKEGKKGKEEPLLSNLI